MKEIHFIGGIHGAGKGTICKVVCEQTKLIHISASELLKWNEISSVNNKKVKKIQSTQDRLINGLSNTVRPNESYLLDGHFCLFNADGEVEEVPIETFEKIAPRTVSVVTTDEALIKERLEKRDKETYDLKVLSEMQQKELKYAEQVASHLKVHFMKITAENYQSLIDELK